MNEVITIAEYRHKRDRRIVQERVAVERRNLVRDCVQQIFAQNPYTTKGF